MVQVENILWLTDFSKDSAHALAYARTLAGLFKTKLYLMHVIENPTSRAMYGEVEGDYLAMEANAREKSRAWLREYANEQLRDLANHEILLHEGDVVSEVLKVEKENAIGTIVVGTHGRSGLSHMLLGSVTEKIIKSVHCPVYVVRHPERVTVR
jgi:nucleotide-binding universal stress UspA family protein